MKLALKAFAVALALSVPSLAAPAFASDVENVNVALLDASSVMGNGTFGMMAPGQGNWNNGMMGGGNGMMSQGQGIWGNGMMGGGNGMMGNGMMGGGMMGMGMMSIRTDHGTVKAGKVHFSVTNWSRAMVHEMLVVSVENLNAPLPYDYGAAAIPEAQVKVLGEVDKLGANETGSLDLDLPAGNYLLICNVADHFASGMVAPLTVSP